MPLNTLRLNQRTLHPNDRITFIKPLPGPHHDLADLYLKRIAAICKPIMKNNWLSVVSLEEFPPNREFVGRNFNNGECIQLVLKNFSGGWLPFRQVQLVMMHELAHIREMNHGRNFWRTRNQFAGELYRLWDRDYTGDGLWGKGTRLGQDGESLGEEFRGQMFTDPFAGDAGTRPHVCGGTYRTQTKTRKRRRRVDDGLTAKERKARKAERKFGTGKELGGDLEERGLLESRKAAKGKPKVANSTRGRELRAQAALARFEKAKKEEGKPKDEESSDDDDDDDYEYEDVPEGEAALDIDGTTLRDTKGETMILVVDDKDVGGDNGMNEIEEVKNMQGIARKQSNLDRWVERHDSTNRATGQGKDKEVVVIDD